MPVLCQSQGCEVEVSKARPGPGRHPKWCEPHRVAVKAASPKDSVTKLCSVPWCGRPMRAKRQCNMHYRAGLRAEGRIKESPWDERRIENRERRRARMKGVYLGPKAPRYRIADRDGWLCGLCGEGIPRVVLHGHPLYLTIDHITPLSKGGEHSPSNVQAAHAHCNYVKGDRLEASAEFLTV